jgi:hypothetical protein
MAKIGENINENGIGSEEMAVIMALKANQYKYQAAINLA